MSVPSQRIRVLNRGLLRPSADYVLYWMLAARRPRHNFALERAIELSRELGKPLLVLEALSAGYPWASDRLHHFVIRGMADNRAAFEKARTCLSMPAVTSRSAACGESSRWSMRMPLFFCQAPA